jgi:predicted Rossmann-fold nucleotide-binding protein
MGDERAVESYISHALYDLVTPDGKLLMINRLSQEQAHAEVRIEGISPTFVGFQIDPEAVFFNLKSTLAQVGLDSATEELSLNPKRGVAEVRLMLRAVGPVGEQMLKLLEVGSVVGKLFAADPRRRVRDPDYLLRMFSRSDQWGRPLLSLGGQKGGGDFLFEVVEGRTIAYLSLLDGRIEYDKGIAGFLPAVARALKEEREIREYLSLHQHWKEGAPRLVRLGEMLLVKTSPLHVRTVFGAVVNELLPQGFRHTTASILQPDTMHSGDIYELHGNSAQEISDIPLEFYTLEPHREHIFFSDRDQLQADLEDPEQLFKAFDTAPAGHTQAAFFAVKGTQMRALKPEDWIVRNPVREEFPGPQHGTRQALMVERYIQKQAAYPFLRAIEDGLITSQGVLLSRYLPSPLLKRMLLADFVQRALKAIYFLQPSHSGSDFFSSEDRALLADLAVHGIPIYWVDRATRQILMFVPRREKDCGMFVPLNKVSRFQRATFFGIYGSNLLEGEFEPEIHALLAGLLDVQKTVNHPLLNPDTPLAMVTGGGPGAMEIGNKVAKELGILSCGNIVDFRPRDGSVVNEQRQNPYVEAKMTYRLDKLVERQAEFHLDFPIFLQGGIGTDFEYALEEVRRKTATGPSHPILLFGKPDYWRQKITSRYQCNLNTGTIKGSEWVSNAFYCVENASQGLDVYRAYFEGTLPIGPTGPSYPDGFAVRSPR